VTAVNDAPTTHDDAAATDEGIAVDIEVLVNDTPCNLTVCSSSPTPDTALNTDLRVAEIAGQPAAVGTPIAVTNGTAVLLSGGRKIRFTPDAGKNSFSYTFGFSYRANDGLWSRNANLSMNSVNSNVANVSISVRDKTPPIVTLGPPTPAPNAAGWNNTAVTVRVDAVDPSNVTSITCTDSLAGSPVIVATGSASTLSGNLAVSGEGTHSLRCTAADGAGNTGAGPGSSNYDPAPPGAARATVKIDTTPPAVTITRPTTNERFVLNANVTAAYSCTDALSGIQPENCVATNPLSVSSVGKKSFTVEATDNAGNKASKSVTYYVEYSEVIEQPKTTNLGSAMPLNWQLKDANGVPILRLTTLIRLTAVFNGPRPANGCTVNNNAGQPFKTLYTPVAGLTGASDYRILPTSSSYRVNWDTTFSFGRGCYTLVWQWDDNGLDPAVVQNPGLLGMKATEVK